MHAFVSYLWEGSPACLMLLSLERGAFQSLREVNAAIAARLLSPKYRAAIQVALEKPPVFELDSVSLTYRNFKLFDVLVDRRKMLFDVAATSFRVVTRVLSSQCCFHSTRPKQCLGRLQNAVFSFLLISLRTLTRVI